MYYKLNDIMIFKLALCKSHLDKLFMQKKRNTVKSLYHAMSSPPEKSVCCYLIVIVLYNQSEPVIRLRNW